MDGPTIQTERLILRPFREEDQQDLVKCIFSDPAVMQTLPQSPENFEEFSNCARQYIDCYSKSWGDEGYGGWAVCSKNEGSHRSERLIGFCGFERGHIAHYDLELGFGYKQSCWGKGVGIEAAIACRDWFLQQKKWDRFYACHYPDNIGSKRILQRIGMKYVTDMDLWQSMEKGIGRLPVYTFEK